jgi:hypothetical protein
VVEHLTDPLPPTDPLKNRAIHYQNNPPNIARTVYACSVLPKFYNSSPG